MPKSSNDNTLSVRSNEMLVDYAAKVRARAYDIFTAVFSEEEQKQIEADKSVGPDIIDIYVAKRHVYPLHAVVDLARLAGFMGASPDDLRLLSEIGVGQETVTPDSKPKWCKETRQLLYRGQVVRTIKRPLQAKNIVAVLDMFEAENWPPRINDPLLGGRCQLRLHATVNSLNNGLSMIRFHADGSGEGFAWRLE